MLRWPSKEESGLTEDGVQDSHRELMDELTQNSFKKRSRDESKAIDGAAVEKLANLTGISDFVGTLLQEGSILSSPTVPALDGHKLDGQQLSPQEERAAGIIIGAQYSCLGAKALRNSMADITIPIGENVDLENSAVEMASAVLRAGNLTVRTGFAALALSQCDLRISWSPDRQ